MKAAFSSALAVLVGAGLAAAQTKFSCPEDKDKTFVTGGKEYKLHCGQGIRGMPIEDEKPCGSIAECAERCAANAQCVHSTFLVKTGKCALKKPGDTFDLANLATWMFVKNVPGQPPSGGGDSQKPITGGGGDGKPSYSCPADGGKKYTTNDVTYELRCGTGHKSTHWKNEPCPSLQECADRCAKTPECYSCDWNRVDKICAFKKAPAETVPWAPGDAWFPAPCPDVRETKANAEPEKASGLQCPTNNGKIWEGSDGTWFYLQCCTDTGVATVIEHGTASSHEDCVEKCVKNKKCRSVSYDSAQSTDNCRMYGNSGFSTTKADRVHYAFVTTPPTSKAPLTSSKMCSTECPSAHGQLYVSVTGENYLMSCYHRHGTIHLKDDRRESYEACMSACAVMPECRSIDYEPRTKRCFYSTHADHPTIRAGAFLSAHSLGCAGACSSCRKKSCDALDNKPLPADAARCDKDDGQLTVAGGEQMRLRCRHSWHSAGETIKTYSNVNSLAECAKRCGEDPDCHGANWRGPGSCFAHPHLDKDGKAPTMMRNADFDSITPLLRSLGEYKEEDIKDSGITERTW